MRVNVVAYVEVWSSNGTENYSKTFTNQLMDMGAKVSKTFNKQVTHVVFKDGYQSTWDKAQKRGTKLVSVLWVEKCRTASVHADESLFPAANPSEHTLNLPRKRRKCMQPKDFIPKTPENDKRLQRKFEKMTEELQRQKTALDDSVPVFLFESHGSLTTSASVKIRSHRHTMEQRLQEMKEKREQLSPTSSQRTEQAHENPDDSLCAASLDISRNALCADESFAGGLYSSLGDLCGKPGCGNQDGKLGEFVKEIESDMCTFSPVLKTSNTHSLASSSRLGELSPQTCIRDLPKAEVSHLRDPGGETITPDGAQAQRVSDTCEEKSSPVTSATRGCLWLHSVPRSSSAKIKRSSVDPCSPPRSTLKRRKSCWRSTVPWEQLLRSSPSLQFPSSATVGTPDHEASSYEDYFSPENLQERTSTSCPPEYRPSADPAHFNCRSLSKRERVSILEMSDLSCIGEKPRSASITNLTAKPTSILQSPACLAAEDTSAAEENPECCRQAGRPQGEDARPTESHHPHDTHSLAGPEQEGSCAPVEGSRAEREPVGRRSAPKEGPDAAGPSTPARHTQECRLYFGGDPHGERSAEEEKENIVLGYSGSTSVSFPLCLC
ncbi:microcephalin isoform X1 [Fukomys damarensis]|uniref:microcephalin isoform X1 n=2 Tax=Fukomys damarensis TaxID=885580 RepID=UPI0008FED37C|nr:microcephalin isoform X1 [Fukomys damarensis]